MHILRRTAAAIGLALLAIVAAPLATAHAADYGHISGSPHPGRVVAAVEHSPHCGGGSRFVLRNSTHEPAAKQDSGPLGIFTVCVTGEAYASYPVGAWFNNLSGTGGPVG